MNTLASLGSLFVPWMLMAGLAEPRLRELSPEVEEELDRLAEVFEDCEEFTATYVLRGEGEERLLTIGYRAGEMFGFSLETDGQVGQLMRMLDGVMTEGSWDEDHECWARFDMNGLLDEREGNLAAMRDLGLDVVVARPRPELHFHVDEHDFDVKISWVESPGPLCILAGCRSRFDWGRVEGEVVLLRSGDVTFTLGPESAGLPSAIRLGGSDHEFELIEFERDVDPDLFEASAHGCEDHSEGRRRKFSDGWRAQEREELHSELSAALEEGVLELPAFEAEIVELFERWYEPMLSERYESWTDELSTWVVEGVDRLDELLENTTESGAKAVELFEGRVLQVLESAVQEFVDAQESEWDLFREDDLLALDEEGLRRSFERVVSDPVLATLEEQADRLLDR